MDADTKKLLTDAVNDGCADTVKGTYRVYFNARLDSTNATDIEAAATRARVGLDACLVARADMLIIVEDLP